MGTYVSLDDFYRSTPAGPSGKKRTRGEAMDLVNQMEKSAGTMSVADRQSMIDDLMNGATMDINGSDPTAASNDSNSGGASDTNVNELIPPSDGKLPIGTRVSLDAFYADHPGASTATPAAQPAKPDTSYIESLFTNTEHTAADAWHRATTFLSNQWGALVDSAGKPLTGDDMKFAMSGGLDMFSHQTAQRRMNAIMNNSVDPAEFHLLSTEEQKAEIDRLRGLGADEAGIKGGVATMKDPLHLWLYDSMPANATEALLKAPQFERNALEAQRKIAMQENILANPDKYPAVTVQAAKQAKEIRENAEPTISAMWHGLWDAAKKDPGKFSGSLLTALVADPEMIAIPAGIPADVLSRMGAAGKVAAMADKAVNAGLAGTALNTAMSVAQQASQKGELSKGETFLAAASGLAIGTGAGLVHGFISTIVRGNKAAGVDLNKLDEASRLATIHDRALADLAAERTVMEERDPMQPTEMQQRINESLGIKTSADRKAWIAARRKEVKQSFAKNEDYADYLKFQAEERARMHEEFTASAAQRPAFGVVTSSPDAPAVELPRASPPSELSPGEVLRALLKPGHQRSAEEVLAVNKDMQRIRGSIDQELLTRAGVAAGGVLLGAGIAANQGQDPVHGGILGGLAFSLLPFGGGSVLDRMRQSGVVSADGGLVGFVLRERKLPNESAVIEKAKTGDPAAQRALYEQYYSRLARSVNPVIRDAKNKLGIDANDIAQDTFLKAFSNLGRFDSRSEFYTWLYRIGQNEALNALAKAKRRVDTTSMHRTAGASGEDLAAGHIIKDADETITPAALDAQTFDSPENIAIANETQTQIQSALDKLPTDIRQAVIMKELDGLTEADIAASQGVPVGTVKSRINRGRTMIEESIAKGYGARPKVPRGQGGAIDERLVKAMALVGAGSLVGAYLNDDNPAGGALVGSALFLGGYHYGSDLLAGADHFAGMMSTRIKNISEPIHRRALDFERGHMEKTHAALASVDPFLVQLNKLKGPAAEYLNSALLTNSPKAVDAILAAIGNGKMTENWKAVRGTLDSIRDQLIALRRFKVGLDDYYPRVVKDANGLMKAIGGAHGSFIKQALDKAEGTSVRMTGHGLSDIERSKIINQAMQDFYNSSTQPGYAKKRSIEVIPKELQQFYATPTEALHSYLRKAVLDIETAKFFGKNLVNREKNGQTYINTDESVGQVVNRELEAGNITDDQAIDLTNLLKSRFSADHAVPWEFMQHVKNYALAGLLGNFITASGQMTDVLISAYTQGIIPIITATARKFTGRSLIDPKSFGLVDHMSEEFVSTLGSAKFLNAVLKYSLFTKIDIGTKGITLDAALINARRMVKTPAGLRKFTAEHAAAYGDDFAALVSDLRNNKNTDLTRSLIFAELSRSQPITKMESSQFYLDNPNGRTLLMLKSWMLKQLDIARRDGYNKIKYGSGVHDRAVGFKNLVAIGITLGFAGVGSQDIKDFLSGKEITFHNEDVYLNILKTFGWSQAMLDKARGKGESKAKPVEAIGGLFIPPYTMFDELLRADPKAVRYVPIVGRPFYDWFVPKDTGGRPAKGQYNMKASGYQEKPYANSR